MAGHRDLRRRRRHLWRPTRPRGVTVHDHRRYRHKDQPDPDRPEAPHQSIEPPNHPGQGRQWDSTPSGRPETSPSLAGPHEETLELKTEGMKQ
ncbi:hypothetical protein D4764_10G0005860 [Takifugu flavidus]|uniref:Uncharacterized protein n=1 Tax=Takifugu flavidus TaxID=433684 RepID=A0A5C6PKY4_9TELE|nr:hypothetical protein D4764_10G0005860 [Takifugu flavidus]